MRILTIDAGNTTLKIRLYNNGLREWKDRLPRVDGTYDFSSFDASNFRDLDIVVAACARPIDEEVILNWADGWRVDNRLYIPKHGGPLPFQYDYTGGAPGPDRLANVAAIRQLSSGKAAIAIDCGTALNSVIIDRRGNFIGGSIMPGAEAMAWALHEKTGGILPIPERFNGKLVETPPEFPALSTYGAIEAGILYSQVGAVHSLRQAAAQALGDESIATFLTGGGASTLLPFINDDVINETDLTSLGLLELGKWRLQDNS